jgi:OOP family OmpA-OmpF porin
MPSPRAEAMRADRRLLLLAAPLCLAACQPANPLADRIAAMQARGVVLRVLFAFNSYAIREEDRRTLDNLAAALADPRLARFTFEINGHTDVVGRLGFNLALSELRAAAVVDYLAGRGVARERLRKQGFGPLQLLDPANPRSEVNRRVEVFAVPPAASPPAVAS